MSTNELSEELRTRICWLYYKEGKTQDEVAQMMGMNRTRILRILANARADGTVQIRVANRMANCVELSRQLESYWGLTRAIVVPSPDDADQVTRIIGSELGAYLSDAVGQNMTIGLGWGKTLTQAALSLEPREKANIQVISLLGGLTRVQQINPSEFAWRVAERLSADCYMLPVPVFAPDLPSRDALMGHSGIAEVFERARSLDMAVMSVGDLSPHSVFANYGLLSRQDIASLQRAGAVGDILCHFISEDGRVIDHPINTRVMSVRPEHLAGANQIVLASGGWNKTAAILGAMRLLRPAVLITDELVAERLLDAPLVAEG